MPRREKHFVHGSHPPQSHADCLDTLTSFILYQEQASVRYLFVAAVVWGSFSGLQGMVLAADVARLLAHSSASDRASQPTEEQPENAVVPLPSVPLRMKDPPRAIFPRYSKTATKPRPVLAAKSPQPSTRVVAAVQVDQGQRVTVN